MAYQGYDSSAAGVGFGTGYASTSNRFRYFQVRVSGSGAGRGAYADERKGAKGDYDRADLSPEEIARLVRDPRNKDTVLDADSLKTLSQLGLISEQDKADYIKRIAPVLAEAINKQKEDPTDSFGFGINSSALQELGEAATGMTRNRDANREALASVENLNTGVASGNRGRARGLTSGLG